MFRFFTVSFYRRERNTSGYGIHFRVSQEFQGTILVDLFAAFAEIVANDIKSGNGAGSDTGTVFAFGSFAQHQVVGIIILIHLILPPSVRKGIQCILGILDLVPSITGDTA